MVIPRGQNIWKLRVDSVAFYVEYFMELPWSMAFFMFSGRSIV